MAADAGILIGSATGGPFQIAAETGRRCYEQAVAADKPTS
jgi:hypothetical protein